MTAGSWVKRKLKDTLYKSLAKDVVLRSLRKNMLSGKVVVLMYHEIASDAEEIEAWTVVRESDFVRQMEYLSSEFDILSLRDALSVMNDPDRGGGRPMAVITFDDGYSGNKRTLLPVMKSLNIPVTIFVATKAVQDGLLYWYDRLICAIQSDTPIALDCSRFSLGRYSLNRQMGVKNWAEVERLLVDLKGLGPAQRILVLEEILKELGTLNGKKFYNIRPLTIDEVKDLVRCPLVTIGAHSHCHNILTQLSVDSIAESLRTSKTLLERWTGRSVSYFAYPNGDYDEKVIGALKAEGFGCGLTTESRVWDRSDPVFTIPRIGIGRYDSMDLFKVKVSGGIRNFFNTTR